MSTLHIQLLGGFHLTEAEADVTAIDTARLQSFLCFLLLHTHKPQPRHYIASLLWPESTESQARTNLRKYIYQLRSKLPAVDQLFDIGGNTIQWRPDAPAVVDVHKFERLLAQAHHYQKWQRSDDAVTVLKQAVSVYQGDLWPACYEEWIALPRERLASQFMQTLDQLAQLLEQQGDYLKAIDYVKFLLERDTLRESSYRRLIHLYALAGNRAKALEACEQCAAVLKRELDIEPSAATQALYQRVKAAQYNTAAQAVRVEMPPSRREQMTVMCTDIAGFTTLSERYDPQCVFADLNSYMNLLRQLIVTGEGQVVKRMGDAILAMFEQTEKALQTAYKIQSELSLFNQRQYSNGRPPFHTRIGLATGEILLAHLGMDGLHEIEIMGKCVNVAVRLQHVTPADTISVDQLTYGRCKVLLQDKIAETLHPNQFTDETVYILSS